MFQPIDERDPVIFDTDIGTDCDDAGALRLLSRMTKRVGNAFPGVAVNASPDFGPGTVDAILCYENMKRPVGKTWRTDIFPDEKRYIKYVAEHFSRDFADGTLNIRDAAELYREMLEQAPDGRVVILTVGFFTTVQEILEKEPELFRRKVRCVVSMAGNLDQPGKADWNVMHDVPSAKVFFAACPCPIYLVDGVMGEGVLTGFDEPDADDPVAEAYRLFTQGGMRRHSWDLLTVDFAFRGECEDYRLVPPVRAQVADEGYIRLGEGREVFFVRWRDEDSVARTVRRLDGILQG